ncbi:rsbT co-antagonist protein RsbR [Alkalihalobacillus xiaoxiensis]|uniref:RsbT co-antagonist protein RsbR n=1 Tax=Shouchella xiaoxiensis TaxID=766895 RepID=A0ABS2SXY5_9BACI|nr:hypothetical protein [Shouchella xiaoxiensis]MBM7840397.1 rsbT co-antagonist protein RsbR [Shouchella xiaoxiensis]
MSASNHLPVPYFELNEKYVIVNQSIIASQSFKRTNSFMELLDVGSTNKVQQYLETRRNGKIEANMSTIHSPFVLFTMHINWVGMSAHVVCIEQDGSLQELIQQVNKQSQRLAKTDFELLEKKEELEDTLDRVKRLSAPFITISAELAYVPFYGELDEYLILMNQGVISSKVHKADYDYLFFDFSGVGSVTEQGLKALLRLVQALQIMGIQIRLIGLKPEHALFLQGNDLKKRAEFNGSLADVLRKHM